MTWARGKAFNLGSADAPMRAASMKWRDWRLAPALTRGQLVYTLHYDKDEVAVVRCRQLNQGKIVKEALMKLAEQMDES